jgi:hypothetical protein
MPLFQTELSGLEIKAREMANTYYDKNEQDLTHCARAALMIFATQAASLALTADKVLERAAACNYVFGWTGSMELITNMENALDALVKGKFLRSRRQGHLKMYEVRF